jgi:hypothetical protein
VDSHDEDQGHTYSHSDGINHARWSVPRLWEAAKNLPIILVHVEDLPFVLTDSWVMHWADPGHPQVAFEAERTARADLVYPVILHPEGYLMDGYHRVCKALQYGFTHVRAVKFTWDTLPVPDVAWKVSNEDGMAVST